MEAFLREHGNKPDVGSYKFKFGKYRNKSFKEVYDTDKSYCAFLFQKLDREKNNVLLGYIEDRVAEEYKEKNVSN